MRARTDLKYLLSLDLKYPGFNYSELSEVRVRLLTQGAQDLLLDKLLELFKERGYVKAGDKQRTDATHVTATIRELNRLELVAETLRATLNEIPGVAPQWLRRLARPDWYTRYARRIEEMRLPRKDAERETFVLSVGRDGYALMP